jgi:hypothetical protein
MIKKGQVAQCDEPLAPRTRVIGVFVKNKGTNVHARNWDTQCLMVDQIKYVCINAFATYKIGKLL